MSSPVQTVAEALLQARKQQRPADAAPLEPLLKSADDAYAVQALVAQGMEAPPRTPRYWKSGGPSRDAVLTHAALPESGVWASPAEARGWHCNVRLIEAEFALRLGRDVTPAEAGRVRLCAAAAYFSNGTRSSSRAPRRTHRS